MVANIPSLDFPNKPDLSQDKDKQRDLKFLKDASMK